MKINLSCIWMLVGGLAFSQDVPHGSKPDSTESKAHLDPNPLKWLSRIDGGKTKSERLLNLTPSEFETAVEYLERGQVGMVSVRFVWLVGGNLKRVHEAIPAKMRDRAAAALVKATDIEDKNLRLNNLSNLGGVNHPLLKDLYLRLASSEDNYTAKMAKRNLEILKDLQNSPISTPNGNVGKDQKDKTPDAGNGPGKNDSNPSSKP